MTDQYLRKVSLVVGSDTEGMELGELQFRFATDQQNLQQPNTCRIRVYNVAETTANKIQKEFTQVLLQAGYVDGQFGQVFVGTLVQALKGRESAADTYLDLFCADGDQAYSFAVLAATLAAGTSSKDAFSAATAALKKYGIGEGFVPDGLGSGGQRIRGKVMFGAVRDEVRKVAATEGANFSIQDGQTQLLPYGEAIPGDAAVISSDTGMVGIPEQTEGGIAVRMLLRPDLKVGRTLQIKPADINRQNVALENTAAQYAPTVTEQGIYKILVIKHSGDTRGNDWYSDVVCIALEDAIPPANAERGYF